MSIVAARVRREIERCKAVRPFVKRMAQQFDAKLTLMHSIQIPTGWYGGFEGAYPIMFDVPAMEQEARQRLDGFFDWPERSKLATAVDHGDPAAYITTYAEQNNVDLIMMATHGYGKFRSLLLGSVAAKVLHDARCAVWTAAHSEDPGLAAHLECRSILCAIELTPDSAGLIRQSVELAGKYGAKLRLVHAVPAIETRPEKYLDEDFHRALLDFARAEIRKLQHQAGTDLGRQPDALRLASRQRARGTVEGQIVQPDVDHEVQPGVDLLEYPLGDHPLPVGQFEGGQQLGALADGQVADLGDVPAGDGHREDLRLEPGAATGVARDVPHVALVLVPGPLRLRVRVPALDRRDVRRLLHDAEHRDVAAGVTTDGAQLLFREVEAACARTHAITKRQERLREAAALVRRLSQEVIGQPQRGLASDARQTRKLGGQIIDRGHSAPRVRTAI